MLRGAACGVDCGWPPADGPGLCRTAAAFERAHYRMELLSIAGPPSARSAGTEAKPWGPAVERERDRGSALGAALEPGGRSLGLSPVALTSGSSPAVWRRIMDGLGAHQRLDAPSPPGSRGFSVRAAESATCAASISTHCTPQHVVEP